ncbi:DUF4397 domain-containing protein [Anaerolineales bacterium HSG25]|nr:DUF4397 domain-containing protein [Anaerolineales bacterium HSG25]
MEELGVSNGKFAIGLTLKTDNTDKITGDMDGFSFTLAGVEAKVDEASFEDGLLKAKEAGLYIMGGGASVYNLEVDKKHLKIGGGKFALPEFKVGGKKNKTTGKKKGGFDFAKLSGELKPIKEGEYEINATGGMKLGGVGGKDCMFVVELGLAWDKASNRQIINLRSLNPRAQLNLVSEDGEITKVPLTPEGISQPIIVGQQEIPEIDDLSQIQARGLSFKNIMLGIEDCEIPLVNETVFLTKVKGGFALDDGTTIIKIEIGLSVGRKIKYLGRPITVDVVAKIDVPYKHKEYPYKEDPWHFNLEGITKLFGIELRKAIIDVDPNGGEVKMEYIPRGPLKEASGTLAVWRGEEYKWKGKSRRFNMTGRLDGEVGIGLSDFHERLPDESINFDVSIQGGRFTKSSTSYWGLKGEAEYTFTGNGNRSRDRELSNVPFVSDAPPIRDRRFSLPNPIDVIEDTVDTAVDVVVDTTKVVVDTAEKVVDTLADLVGKSWTVTFFVDTDLNFSVGGDAEKYQLVTRNRIKQAKEALDKDNRLRNGDQNAYFLNVDSDVTFLPTEGGDRSGRAGSNGPQARQQDVLVDVDVSYPTEMMVMLESQEGGPTMSLISPDGTVYGQENLPDGVTYAENVSYVQSLGLSPAASQGLGQLRVVNGVAGQAIDVLLNDQLIFSNVAFTSTTIYKTVEPGAYQLKFVSTGTSGSVLAETSLNLGPGLDYTVLATGQPEAVMAWPVVDNNAPRGTESTAYLRLLHAADGVSPLSLDQLFGQEIFEKIAYQQVGNYFSLSPNNYHFNLMDSETGEVLVDLQNIALEDGGIYSLFVYNTEQGVQAVLHQDAVAPTSLKIIHHAIIRNNLSFSVDGRAITTEQLYLLAGSHDVQVSEGGTVLLNRTVELITGTAYSLVFFDESGMINSLLLENNTIPDVGNTGIRFVNLSPGSPAVDVTITDKDDGIEIPLFSHISFKEVGEQIEIPSSAHYYSITDTTKLIAQDPFTVTVYEAGTENILSMREYIIFDRGSNMTLDLLPYSGTLVVAGWDDTTSVKETIGMYILDKSELGKWQVKLSGDTLGTADYKLSVTGKKPVPELSDVHIVQNDGQPTLQWRLTSGEPDTSVAVYYKSTPIIETSIITDENGVAQTVEAPVYSGRTITSALTSSDASWIDGTLQSHAIETNLLRGGTYYVYVAADDMAHEPIRMVVPEPLVVEHSWPDSWESGLTLTQTTYRGVTAQWNPFPNPDLQEYLLVWSSSSSTETHTTSVSGLDPEPSYTVTNLNSDETYTFTVDALDNYNERVSVSEVALVTIKGAEFELTASGALPNLKAGQSVSKTLELKTNLDPYPGVVGLYVGPRSPGLEMMFIPDMITPTITGTHVTVVITANEFLSSGILTATVEASGGGEERTLELKPQIVAPTYALTVPVAGVTLTDSGIVTLPITAMRFDGHERSISLEVVDYPPILWSYDNDTLTETGTITTILTLEDTSITERGVYTLLIQADDGPDLVTITRTLTILKPDFVITVPEPITATLGQTNTLHVPLQMSFQDGWSNPVNLVVDTSTQIPMGQYGFNPDVSASQADDMLDTYLSLDEPGTVDFIVETLPGTSPGSYPLSVIAQSGDRQYTIPIEVVVAEVETKTETLYLPIILKQ